MNREYLTGSINLDVYNAKILDFDLYKIRREFAEGKYNLEQFNIKLEELNIRKLNLKLAEGTIALQDFNEAVAKSQIAELNAKVDAGTISWIKYEEEIVKVSQHFLPGSSFVAGTQSYLESIGTTSQQVAEAIKNTFTGVENAFTSFIKTGTFNFNNFTQSVLDDLAKIIVRSQIVGPIAQGLQGLFTPTAGASIPTAPVGTGQYAVPFQANGGVWDKGIQKYASGGIVNSPTMFGHRSGVGIMGEAGPEAILPLARGSGGQLGVQATVTPVNINIVNQSDAGIQARESTGPGGERTIELLISGKVKEGIASGTYDKIFQQSFGLRRKGV